MRPLSLAVMARALKEVVVLEQEEYYSTVTMIEVLKQCNESFDLALLVCRKSEIAKCTPNDFTDEEIVKYAIEKLNSIEV